MLMQKVQHSLITPLILLPDLGIFKIRARSHPPMNLRRKSLHVIVRLLQVRPKGLHVLGVLVLGRQQRHGDGHRLGIIRGQHSGVALHRRLEGLVLGARGEARDLAAPAVAQDGPVEGAAGGELVGLGHDARDLGQRVGRGGLGLEEVAELLLVLVGLGREPGDVGRLALEEVWHEDAVFLRVGGGEDVGALDGLVEEAEDIYFLMLSAWVDCP